MPIWSQSLVPFSMLASALAFAFSCGGARAVSIEREFAEQATGECQAALPMFDAQLRKRPLAIQNEGTSTAFVSCSLMSTSRSVNGVKLIQAHVETQVAGPIDITCTLVTGLSKTGTSVLLPKTASRDHPGKSVILWIKSDNGGVNFDNFTINLSCALPPGSSLSQLRVIFDEDVGA